MRLGKFNGKVFDTNVGKATFDRVLIGLRKYTEWEQVRTIKSEVFYRESDGVRITLDETTNEETIVRKERVKNEDFKKLIDDICQHIAATDPLCVNREEVAPEVAEEEENEGSTFWYLYLIGGFLLLTIILMI